MLNIVWASLFVADVPDAEVPLQAGSAVVRTAQVGSDTDALAEVTAPKQALAAGSTAKPQVLYLQSTPCFRSSDCQQQSCFFVTYIAL